MPEILKIILSIGCIIALIYLASSMYSVFIARHTSEQAKGTLDDIIAIGQNINRENDFRNYLITAPQEGYIVSFEKGYSIERCKSKYCLCLCKDSDCDDIYLCEKTDRFFSMRDKDGKETRKIEFEIPFDVNMSFVNVNVYPFNGVLKEDSSNVPLFFKFDNGWKWSLDLKNWMNVSSNVVSGGLWNGEILSIENQGFLSNINNKNEEDGKSLIIRNQGFLSSGIVIIQAKK